MSETSGHAVRGFFGALLMAVGGLVATLSGLCTMLFMITSLFEGGGDHLFKGADVLILALVIGGAPFGIGLGVFYLGRSLHRRARPAPAPPPGPLP